MDYFMSKSMRGEYFSKLSFEHLLSAHDRARENKTNKKSVLVFEMDLESNIINILRKLQNNTYEFGEYRIFTIKEPKERIIKALPYIDRVVNQWYVYEFIKPYFVPRFIKDTYACIDGRGTHLAVTNLQNYMRRMKRNNDNYYILKCDVRKFFDNINKDILYNILNKHIKDKDLFILTKKIIYDNEEKVGIPIGNYTSQYFANIYLNELDQYIKRILKIKYYVRYMDDFILLLDSKEEAKKTVNIIDYYLHHYLGLSLNEKSRYYPRRMGVNFCGYRIFETHILLRTNSKQKIKRNIKIWNKAYLKGELDTNKTKLQFNSWLAHASHANSYNLQRSVIYKLGFSVEQRNE